MRSLWPASLGALFVIAATLSALFAEDPLEFTDTSYGTLPSAYGALHDLLRELDVPVSRSFAAPLALPARDTVWWIDPESLCAKLPAADPAGDAGAEPAGGETPDPAETRVASRRDWDPAPWIEGGGTALIFTARLADCATPRRIGALALPVPRRVSAQGEEIGESPERDQTPATRGDWPAQIVTGVRVPERRSLPLPTLATFDVVPAPFQVIATVDGAPFAVEAPLGAGRLVLIADSVFLRNLWLDAGDAAPLAFDWVRAYGVPRFDEREHGLSDTPSTLAYLAGSPALPVFGGLAVCGLLFGWAGAVLPRRRLGEARPAPPTLRTYVDSLARLYARAGDHGEALARYREHTLGALRRSLGLAHDAPLERVLETLRALPGVDPADLAALREEGGDPRGDAELERRCQALDRLRESAR